MPVDIIYMKNKGEISYRTVIVKNISEDRILVYDLMKKKPRIFKRANILSADKHRKKKHA